jgi:hypothetical protein
MGIHVEKSSAEFKAGANLLANIRNELEIGSAEHSLLLVELARGPRGEAPLSMNEAAVALLEGRPLPSSAGVAMAEAQARELALRQRLEQLRSMERRISERLEWTRVRAREEAVALDPRSKDLAKLWQAAEDAARAAYDLERSFRAELLAGAFGTPELARPEWVVVELLD